MNDSEIINLIAHPSELENIIIEENKQNELMMLTHIMTIIK